MKYYWSMLRFFVPMIVASALNVFSYVAINAGLARTVGSATAIAAYAVAVSISAVFDALVAAFRPTSMTLVRGIRDFKAVSGVGIVVITLFAGLNLVVFLPPVGTWVFETVFDVGPDLIAAVLGAGRMLALFVWISGIRELIYGLIIRARRTEILTLAMLARLVTSFGLVALFVRTGVVSGAMVGAVTFTAGVLAECLVCVGWLLFRGLPALRSTDEETQAPPRVASVLAFYLPLAGAMSVAALGNPFLNAGLSRTASPTTFLAAHSVAYTLGMLFLAPCLSMHKIVVVFWDDSPAHVRRFVRGFALFSSALLLMLAVSGLGAFILSRFVGVTDELLPWSLAVLRVQAVLPLVFCWVDYSLGHLMRERKTGYFFFSKALNVVVTGGTVLAVVHFRPDIGVAVGVSAVIVGYLAEGSLLWWVRNRRVPGMGSTG